MFKRLSAALTSFTLAFAAPSFALSAVDSADPAAKLSARNICHERGSDSYEKTTRFTAFDSLDECLKHGRLPKGNEAKSPPPAKASDKLTYDRDAFGGWVDADGNCMNTRHEVLLALSTATVTMKNRCSVERGRWIDPYTDKIFTKAQDLDIDHMVPLAYAWQHGAMHWDKAKRVRFANDPANLFAVDKSTNRDKGAKGPLQWLPPAQGYHCQYITRFIRISLSYQLDFSKDEKDRLEALRQKKCS